MYGKMPKYVCKDAKVCMQRCERIYAKMRSSKQSSNMSPLVCMQTCGNMGSVHACRKMGCGHVWRHVWLHSPRCLAALAIHLLPPPKHALSASMYANMHHALPSLNACMYEDRIGWRRIWHSRIQHMPYRKPHSAIGSSWHKRYTAIGMPLESVVVAAYRHSLITASLKPLRTSDS